MFKNFFTLNRQVVEVNKLLANFSLVNVFTQEKNKLIFCLRNDCLEIFIEINADSQFPYFIVREKFYRAKKNTMDFFDSYLPSKLKSIKIAELDRVIKFSLQEASIYFYIHGKETNVILIDKENKLKSFKKIENKYRLIDEIWKLNFTDSFQNPEINLSQGESSPKIISREYPFLGKEIIAEMIRRSKNNSSEKKEAVLKKILEEIETGKPFVYKEESSGKYNLSFFSPTEPQADEHTYFNTVNDALKYFIMHNHKQSHEILTEKVIDKKFEKKIIQLKKKRERIQTRINEGCKEKTYQQIANLIMMNISNIKIGTTKVDVENIYESNKIISIDLIPKLTLMENVNYYFEKAKSERKEFKKLTELLSEINEEIRKQNEFYDKMKNTEPRQNQPLPSQVHAPIKDDKSYLEIIKNRFKQFVLFDKYLIFVGKNSKNNDELTTRFAKQNDYWFHARSVSGSHVVLKYDKSHGEIQKIVLEKTASIAAFYSKAKTSGLVPVSYTQKKYVVKRKGMEPGKVHLLKEKVLIVRPEIPKECKSVNFD